MTGTSLTAVIWNDRHSDPTAHLFTDYAAAVEWAWEQAWAMESIHEPAQVDWRAHAPGDLSIGYGIEGDHLYVTNVVVDHELSKKRE